MTQRSTAGGHPLATPDTATFGRYHLLGRIAVGRCADDRSVTGRGVVTEGDRRARSRPTARGHRQGAAARVDSCVDPHAIART